MCEDALELAIEQLREITPVEFFKDQPVTEPEEADVEEFYSRGVSARLLVEDVGEDTDDEVKEVEAQDCC